MMLDKYQVCCHSLLICNKPLLSEKPLSGTLRITHFICLALIFNKLFQL